MTVVDQKVTVFTNIFIQTSRQGDINNCAAMYSRCVILGSIQEVNAAWKMFRRARVLDNCVIFDHPSPRGRPDHRPSTFVQSQTFPCEHPLSSAARPPSGLTRHRLSRRVTIGASTTVPPASGLPRGGRAAVLWRAATACRRGCAPAAAAGGQKR